jgi:hypothetical protein
VSFSILDSLSVPGDPARSNEDAFAAESFAAAVFDGATPVNDPLMPGRSDAAWIAQFGARRLLAHLKDGNSPRGALRHALSDAEHSFAGLRRRPLDEPYELPCASMMLLAPRDGGVDALWYGDCAAITLAPDGRCGIVGEALHKRASEAGRAQRLADSTGLAPAAALSRAKFLPQLRAARSKINTAGGGWLFSPDASASEHVSHAPIALSSGTLILLCTDGFLALTSDYGAMGTAALVEAARDDGLQTLAGKLRAIEEADAEGRRYPRFKKSDDATAILLQLV